MDDYRDVEDRDKVFMQNTSLHDVLALRDKADDLERTLNGVIRTLRDNRSLGLLKFIAPEAEQQFDEWLQSVMKRVPFVR